MKMGMNVNVGLVVVDNSHPKDLSKSPTFVGFFVTEMMGRFSREKDIINCIIYISWVFSRTY